MTSVGSPKCCRTTCSAVDCSPLRLAGRAVADADAIAMAPAMRPPPSAPGGARCVLRPPHRGELLPVRPLPRARPRRCSPACPCLACLQLPTNLRSRVRGELTGTPSSWCARQDGGETTGGLRTDAAQSGRTAARMQSPLPAGPNPQESLDEGYARPPDTSRFKVRTGLWCAGGTPQPAGHHDDAARAGVRLRACGAPRCLR